MAATMRSTPRNRKLEESRYPYLMRIDVRDVQRRRIGRVVVDPQRRPTRVRIEDTGREVFLYWEAALDDSQHLRRCIVCGCRDLFRSKAFPQVTGVVVVLAFAGAAVGALGLATTPPILTAMVAVLVADVSILLLARRRLVCHRCRTSYSGLPIARYHRSWDRVVAERHTPVPSPAPRVRTGRPKWWAWRTTPRSTREKSRVA